MSNTRFLVSVVCAAVLTGCGTTDHFQQRADQERERREKEVSVVINQAPKWMAELPKSTSAIYANGSASSTDLGMADEKAKTMAAGKLCMAAGGEVDQQTRVFRLDQGDSSVENSEMAIRGMCRTVDISGAEVIEVKRVSEGVRFRSYVLLALPTGDANAIQRRRDQQLLQKQAAGRGDAAFREMTPRTDR